MTAAIKIVIADDHDLYLDGLKGLFKDNKTYRIIGEARNGIELIQLAITLKPQLILTDLRMPMMHGASAIHTICKKMPDINCIVLTSYENDAAIIEALEAGAKGYITKNMPKTELFQALDQICAGYPYFCQTTNAKMIKLISQSNFNPFKKKKQPTLSQMETKVACLICHEKSNREISDLLFTSIRTIENIRARIYRKMNVKSSVGVAVYAFRNGIIQAEEISA
ncbi:MAG TPA: response regulator transcription factor [Sediminibacterium sp.]|nr:response regulator transcription factor [Sediminibacterium sp.]